MKEKTTVLICDDHTLFREGIKGIVCGERWIEVLDEAMNGRDAVSKAQSLQPDIVLMDISMPDLGGLEATGRIIRTHPKIKVIMLTMYDEEEVITRCLRAGASGYVLKDASLSELLHAIEVVRGGGQYRVRACSRKWSGNTFRSQSLAPPATNSLPIGKEKCLNCLPTAAP